MDDQDVIILSLALATSIAIDWRDTIHKCTALQWSAHFLSLIGFRQLDTHHTRLPSCTAISLTPIRPVSLPAAPRQSLFDLRSLHTIVPVIVTLLMDKEISWGGVTGYSRLINCLGNFLE